MADDDIKNYEAPFGGVDREKGLVTYEYEKGNHHRVIFVNGAHGGLTPDGRHIVLSVFSERQPIPTREVYELKDDTSVGERKDLSGRRAIFREIEATLILDSSTAKSLMNWIKDKIVAGETTNQGQQDQK